MKVERTNYDEISSPEVKGVVILGVTVEQDSEEELVSKIATGVEIQQGDFMVSLNRDVFLKVVSKFLSYDYVEELLFDFLMRDDCWDSLDTMALESENEALYKSIFTSIADEIISRIQEPANIDTVEIVRNVLERNTDALEKYMG